MRAPSAPTPQPDTLAGLWAGAIGLSAEDGRSLGLTWNAQREGGGQLSGTATLSTSPSAPAQVTFVGTLASAREGDRFVLTFTPQTDAAQSSGCSASGSGLARLDGNMLVGDLQVTYAACDALGLQPPASTRLQLLPQLN
jgi:hypothetical protein